MGKRIIETPAAVIAANTATNFPTGTPPLRSMLAAAVNFLTEGTPNVYVKTVLTIVTAAPTSGEARLVGTDQWELGDATTDGDTIEFDVEERGTLIRSP